jgi:hypothetical protein
VKRRFIPKAFFFVGVVGWGFSSILSLFCGFRSAGVRDAQTRANISTLDPGVVKMCKETNKSQNVSQERPQKKPTQNAILPPQYLEIKKFPISHNISKDAQQCAAGSSKFVETFNIAALS